MVVLVSFCSQSFAAQNVLAMPPSAQNSASQVMVEYVTSFIAVWLIKEACQLGLRAMYGDQGLITAVKDGNLPEVRKLIGAAANVNAADGNGYTALMWAAVWGHTDILKVLLATERIEVNAVDHNARNALVWAAYWGRTSIVNVLLSAGAEKGNAEEVARLEGHNNLADIIRDYTSSGRLTKAAGKG